VLEEDVNPKILPCPVHLSPEINLLRLPLTIAVPECWHWLPPLSPCQLA